jgi:hypothetical protein
MNKKIIKLTEKDIESLVEKIIKEEDISELDKKTYTSAATKARERGMGKLGDKFAAHGREHGTNIIDTLSFEVKNRGTMVLRNLEFKDEGNYISNSGEIIIKGELVSNDGDNGKKYTFNVFLYERDKEIKTYLFGNNLSLPSTVKDAKNYIQFLNDNGVDTFDLRPKQLTSGYVNYMSEQKRLKEDLPRRERERQETNYRKSSFEPYKREGQLMDIFGPYKDDVPPNVISYMRKNPALIIKRLEQVYGRETVLRYLGINE